VWGALLGVLLYGLLWTALPVLSQEPVRRLGDYLIPVFVMLAVLGIIGDLFESWIKRAAGAKDSGWILPGHGGLLDRIDAMTATLPAAALMQLLFSE
jgi:phosphatidate cytidylyltransferase